MTQISEIVGIRGVYETLMRMEASSTTSFPQDQIEGLMFELDVESPTYTLNELVAANLLHKRDDQIGLTTLGIRTCLLLEAINGGDLQKLIRRLRNLDLSLKMYELIREGMTRSFLRNLSTRPGFGRLYFCSPWISLDKKQTDMLTYAVTTFEETRGGLPEILVITRPIQGTEKEIPDSLEQFQTFGAQIFLNKHLHTKLYIREPDTSGGFLMAIIGSQNLTKSRYIELGIRINSDSQMINQLIAYFLELTNHCYEA